MGQDSVRSIHDLERIAQGAAHKGESVPLPDLCDDPPREFGLRIGRDGTWFYRNSPIQRLPLVKLFASVLRRGPDGRYWLVTPVERGVIDVDDAPFLAVDVDASTEAADQNVELIFTTNLGETVVAGPDHPIRLVIDEESGEPAPYILVRDGLEALINRATFYRLADMAAPRNDGSTTLGVWSGGVFFPLDGAFPVSDDC